MAEFEHPCSRYHAEHGERHFNAGDEEPGQGWHDTPAAAGLVNVGQNGPVWERAAMVEPERPVEIPTDWADLHWSKQVALAKKLGGSAANKEEAAAVIEAALIARAEA